MRLCPGKDRCSDGDSPTRKAGVPRVLFRNTPSPRRGLASHLFDTPFPAFEITTPYTLPAMNRLSVLLLSLLVLTAAACGGGTDGATDTEDQAASSDAVTAADIGPVQSVDLGPLDEALAAEGEEIFNTRCTTCHKMDQRYVGPPLGDVMSQRDPVYVMNMILAPEKMLQQHPDAQEMLAEYSVPMTNQNLTEEQARAILEYLRQVDEAAPATN